MNPETRRVVGFDPSALVLTKSLSLRSQMQKPTIEDEKKNKNCEEISEPLSAKKNES